VTQDRCSVWVQVVSGHVGKAFISLSIHHHNKSFMKELIERLQREAGLTSEQAIQSIEVIKNFTKEKFPMFGSAIDSLFADKQADDDFMP
jgi:hypothetical protein